MIHKMTSRVIMDILTRSQESISDMSQDILQTKHQLQERLAVIQNAQEFLLQQVNQLHKDVADGYNYKSCNKLVFATADIQNGVYDLYGGTICPKSLKTAVNVFNIATDTDNIFKNNVTVKINDVVDDSFKSMLIDDSSANKGVSFKEFDNSIVKLEIAVNPDDLLGSTDFNTIEILPHIPGSLTLQEIDVYDMQGYLDNNIYPVLTIKRDITNMTAMRFLLDKTRTLYRLILKFKLNFINSANKYPFGIKRIYLTKENYDTDSYAIVKMKNTGFIRSIGEKIVVTDQNGVYESTLQEEGVQLYMNYINNNLDHQIDISDGLNEKVISRNIKEFYAKIPIDKTILSIKFSEIYTK